MVADILQFTQIMRGDDRRHSAASHGVGHQAFDRLTDHRIEPVEGLIADDIGSIGSQRQEV